MVFITPDAERTMNTYLRYFCKSFPSMILMEKEIKDSEYIYLEGYLASSKTAKEAAIMAKNIGRKKRGKSCSNPF